MTTLLGEEPTGIVATTFIALMSTAVVVSDPVLATYRIPLGANVSQFGRMPV